jgi:mono/diheme cytochrome c family protein
MSFPQFQFTTLPRSFLAAGLLLLVPAAAWADSSTAGISEGFRFSQQDGEAIYRASCQSCHMATGLGAQGAGMYPALAGNSKLAAKTYPAYTVLKGRKGMPAFGQMMSDQQIAAVANYVRTNLGNDYKDALTAAEVKALR